MGSVIDGAEPAYSYLDVLRKEIRLIKLEPGEGSSPVECSLEPVLLQHYPTYEALSYVWGSSADNVQITIDERPCTITRNLYDALMQLRFPGTVRTLWIDRICINQNDWHERSTQVAIMDEIFRNAQRVVVWLGASTETSNQTIQAVRNYVEFHVGFENTVQSWMNDRYVMARKPVSLYKGARKKQAVIHKDVGDMEKSCFFCMVEDLSPSCIEVFTRPWWTRLWTVQELVLAYEAEFVWGSASISWKALSMAISHYQGIAYDANSEYRSSFLAVPLHFADIRNRKTGRQGTSLLNLIQSFHENSVTDTRDCIYAFLGIASDFQLFEPDYTKTPGQVYLDFTKHCISKLSNLDVLCMAGVHEDLDTPSWVPGNTYFACKSRPPPLYEIGAEDPLFTATPNTKAIVSISEGLILKAEGWLFGIVGGVGQSAPSAAPFDYMAVLQDWEQLMFRTYGDAGSCSKKQCSSQLFYENAEPDFASETCNMSISCVLDHWHRRTVSSMAAWPDNDDEVPQKLEVPQSPITQSREDRLERAGSPTRQYWGGDAYFPTGCGLGEAFCRTLLADTLKSWKGNARLDFAMENSRRRSVTEVLMVPSRSASYPDFLAAFCDSFVPKWDYQEAERISLNWCMNCSRYGSRQVHVANNHILLCKSLEKAISGRRFITSVSGLIGLAPAATQPGDCLVVLAGCAVPFVLRKHGDVYTLIGECYVHGVMDGYLMKGFKNMEHWKRTFSIK